ncbi:probable serine/threonine-protein kinase DDB_G0267514 [Mercenaria mercenaria]|uniref:probable serine/threonine-protein kinase DDB_G0267514 n=1 Tax=Mercenaria mercenaria TaxID=6596 RepID=UPI00234F64CB|nr:probable serine/threonine-protein kinase DDB_G0267514 [Mercenaria mercenaria]
MENSPSVKENQANTTSSRNIVQKLNVMGALFVWELQKLACDTFNETVNFTDIVMAFSSLQKRQLSNVHPSISSETRKSKEIGNGAFGTVYKGRWNGTKVAIKEIVMKRIEIAKPFIDRELCVQSKLRHPNSVLLMAYALASDQLYLVSELIKGCILDNCLFCNEENAMTMSVKLTVSLKVTQATVHSQDPIIIHRDIKPENILVLQDFHVVMLRDMDLSKLRCMNTVMTTMAGGSSQPGTLAYQTSEVMLERSSSNFNNRCVEACVYFGRSDG